MTDEPETLAEKERRIAQLEAEIARSEISRLSGVRMHLLGDAATEEEARTAADQALDWRTAPAPPAPTPPTSAVPMPSVGQISRETLGYLGPADQLAFWRQGRLEGIGAPAPPPRRNGEQHRNAAP
jgi:hypothetical protein